MVHLPDLALTSADLTALVNGDAAQVEPLEKVCSGQLSKHKLLLWAVVRLGATASAEASSRLREHYDLFAAAEKKAPEAAGLVLRHPHVGAWAARSVRLASTEPGSADLDLDYLGAIAASAAIRAGYTCSLVVRYREGGLVLPTLGRAVLPGTRARVVVSGPGKAEILTSDRTVAVATGPDADRPGWEGLRVLSMGDRRLFLDDLDPNRHYEPYSLPGRLDARDVVRWQQALDDAWDLLIRDHPSYAVALRGGLMSLVPIGQQNGDRNFSATSGDAFGAVAASIPSDGAALAVTLMHEYQHAKLCAINDLEPLFEPFAESAFYAPWRPDPRPADALLHGIFAHMAVADFWRVHRDSVSGDKKLVANVEFARWLRQTWHAARLLDGHSALTPAGRHVLSHVLSRLTCWLAQPVPARARQIAAAAALDHLACWRLRNLVPDPDDIGRLVLDWFGGRPAHGTVRTRVRQVPLTFARNRRPELLYRRLRDPGRFEAEHAASADPDVAYARVDQTAAAAQGYLAQLREDPAQPAPWAGLAATSSDTMLSKCLEVAYAVYGQICSASEPPDPLRVVSWLDSVSASELGVQV